LRWRIGQGEANAILLRCRHDFLAADVGEPGISHDAPAAVVRNVLGEVSPTISES
jgi:hypothetical protein